MNAVLSHIGKHILITNENDISVHIQVFIGIYVFVVVVLRSS